LLGLLYPISLETDAMVAPGSAIRDHGPADEEVPFGAAVRMAALLPDAEVVTLAEEGPAENGHHLDSIDLGLDRVLSRYRGPHR
jgi:hypothetical protein